MNTWLKCQIGEGQFSGEYAISGTTFDGESFSLFAPEQFVEVNGDVALGPVEGWIRVEVLAQEGELSLVSLPRPSLDNGLNITVQNSQLSARAAQQEA